MRQTESQSRDSRGRSQSANSKDPLSTLLVIDKLTVGPLRLEKKKVIAPYTVDRDGTRASFDFEYSFEEEVFDVNDPRAQNLAHMMTAQVALNYGLFCKEIAFHGPFDQADKNFLHAMAENTAREIFVMKFLRPNPFLEKEATNLPPVKKPSYLAAKLSFPDAAADTKNERGALWQTAPEKHAVLSSGGKDSLLSFALIEETGLEAHPIFVNESGRHWFTALNAFRHFKKTQQLTARVWTNSDRLFSWMLRHMPFIRQDFARVRSDEYPIRLWTVAVFLFGILPLMRKRGIGRVLIGDEFDTTAKSSYQGITHYNGLYDQSRYFDNALTRYFMRKGWNISQFSILRTLSELLIEKILTERYPQYQKHQVSCHATHSRDNHIYPCGKCEKCRRIVAMLSALGANAENCGYTPAQIEACLQNIAEKGVHQEAGGAAHLRYLLQQKGLTGKTDRKTKPAKPHFEIMKLRFSPDKSPPESIPVDLRDAIYKIFLAHTDGAVQRNGRVWIEFDPLEDNAMLRPYPFEAKPDKMNQPGETRMNPNQGKRDYVLGELSWPEAKERLKHIDIALLPVGAIEQHGPHLPLDTDAFDAEYLAMQVAANCADPKPLVLPLIPYGVSYHHDDFSGTISVTNETLARLVYEVGMSAARNGITKLLIINGHGGNAATLQFAAQTINRDAHIFTCVDTGETSDTDIDEIAETPNDVHAGEIETSTTMAIRPDLVNMKKARKFVPHFSSRYLNFSSKRSVEWNARTMKISPNGVLGDPTKASKEKGEQIWNVMIKNLVEFVEQLKKMTLDEIYEKRY